MIAVFVLMMVGLAIFVALVGAIALRALFWLVLLPLRLVFGLLLLPLLLIKGIVLLLFGVIGPVLAVVAGIVGIVLLGALAVPLAPFLAMAFVAWLFVRLTRRPTALVR